MSLPPLGPDDDPFARSTPRTRPEPPPQSAGFSDFASPPVAMPPPPPPVVYPVDPAPMTASDAKNWMGIVSLVLGFVGGGLLGAIFGHLGLAAVKRGEANNRGIALAGVILNYVMMALGITVLIVVMVLATSASRSDSVFDSDGSGFDERDWTAEKTVDDSLASSEAWFDLSLGDCVTDYRPDDTTGDEVFFNEPTVVPCSSPHYAEVYAVASLGGGGSPTDEEFWDHVARVCEGHLFTEYVGTGYYDSVLYYEVMYPSDTAWYSGNHEMVCLIVGEDDQITGSFRNTGI